MIARVLVLCLCVVAPSLGARLPYIVGGVDSELFTATWMCSLRHFGTHACGASIISSEWLVTAAHCVGPGLDAYCGYYRLGDYDGVQREVKQAILHENYGSETGQFVHDMAVLHIEYLSLSSIHLDAIPMWESTDGEPAGNLECMILGWGLTADGEYLETLQLAYISVYNNTDCVTPANTTHVDDSQVCAGDPLLARGTCTGDAGGSLVCEKDREYKLVGVSSWQHDDCSTDYASIFSRISYYRDWVRDKTGM